MKITLNELTNAAQSVKKLSAFDFGSPRLNYKFMNVVEIVESESKKLMELRHKIIEKYRDKDNKKDIIIPFENTAAFNDEMDAAGNLEVKIIWEAEDVAVDKLIGFTASDMKCLDGKFINIKGE